MLRAAEKAQINRHFSDFGLCCGLRGERFRGNSDVWYTENRLSADIFGFTEWYPLARYFYRVFKFMDKEKFSACLYRWSREILSELEQSYNQISIDGKVLCGTAESGKKKSGVCIVSAWASEHCLVGSRPNVMLKTPFS